MIDFKTIKIPLFPVDKHKEDLRVFFGQYPKDDIYFEIAKDGLVVNVRQLDFPAFKANVELTHSNNELNKVLGAIVSNIESIKSYGLKGAKRLYVGYNQERKVKNRKDKEKNRGLYYYAQNHNFSKQNNALPEKYVNKIITGDSAQVLKNFPDNSVDLVFTSPPYNFGLDYDNHKDGTDWNDYFAALFSVFKQCIRVLKYGGRIIVNVQPLFSDYIPIHHIISNFFMNEKMIWKGEVVWDKHNWNCKYTAWGSWKSPSNPYLKYTWEFLEIFSKGDLKKQGERKDIDISADEFKKLVLAKWDIAPERKMKEYGHPAMFPENLAGSAMKLFSYRQDIILDPFNGVGTTTAVAKKLGRRYVGIDISEEYNKKAEKRLDSIREEKTISAPTQKISESSIAERKRMFLDKLASPSGKTKYKRYVGAPIRYAGGKSLAVGLVIERIPDNVKTVVSPFLGGGSVEVAISKELGLPVIGYDIFDILINYWRVQLSNPKALYKKLLKFSPNNKGYYAAKEVLKKHWKGTKKLNRLNLAAHYYFNHNTSYGPGFLSWPSSVYMNEEKYKSMIEKVRDFRMDTLKVGCASFEEIIPKYKYDFLYCDPPYYLNGDSKMFRGIYPQRNFPIHHNSFNHELLRDLLMEHKGGFILSYNDCSTIREWYKDFDMITPSWQYTMGQGETRIGVNRKNGNNNHVKKSHELLIWKFPI